METVNPEQARVVREALQEAYVQGFQTGWNEGHSLTILQGQSARRPAERHVRENEFPHSPIASATREVADDFRAALRAAHVEGPSVPPEVDEDPVAAGWIAAPATQEAPSEHWTRKVVREINEAAQKTRPSAPAAPLERGPLSDLSLGTAVLENALIHHERRPKPMTEGELRAVTTVLRAALSVSTSAPKETSEPRLLALADSWERRDESPGAEAMSEHKESPLGAAVRQAREGPDPVAMIQAFNEGKHGDAPRSPMYSPEGEPIPPTGANPVAETGALDGENEREETILDVAGILPAAALEAFTRAGARDAYGYACALSDVVVARLRSRRGV